jgi:CRP-like cAMP-binding protein
MNSGPGLDPASWAVLKLAGDEAILPAGIRLTDERQPGKQCFLLLEGTATVEVSGRPLRRLPPGAFVGSVDRAGRPRPADGVTVRMATDARVLVIDARRLATLVDTDPAAAAAWRRIAKLAPL